ncbi:MAG TPA: rhodanese-like domain-containing protein [Actinomycetota bacterium]|nr:rhodanese-like domain-containing protein [Actinomycetota bacterium]
MFFRQFVLESLGHASYLVGDEATGKALLLDPRRDVDDYFAAARAEGLRIVHAIDTHGHNDYLSGLREVVARQPVEVLGFDGADLGYDHRPVKDGEVVEIGDVSFEVVHTPGHTPEHVSLVVRDHAVGDDPALMLSGGALLVGDLARPDLLGGPDDARDAAVTFCHTIQERILFALPDDLEVFPTHVAGSLCGGNIGSRLSTTLGYERKTNAILARVSTSEEFVDECIRLDNLPAVPPYWRRMRAQNLAGPPLLGVVGEPSALRADDVAAAMTDGAIVLDARSPAAFAGGHVPGALNVGLGASFPTWAGTVLPADASVVLVLDRPDDLWAATWELLRIGYAPPVGWLAGGMNAWRTSGHDVATLPQATVHEVRELLERRDVAVLDVRQPAEWADGHVPGATFVTGAELPARLDDVPNAPTVAVVCGSGFRSTVAASLIRRAHGARVVNVAGGMSAWRAAGYPVER